MILTEGLFSKKSSIFSRFKSYINSLTTTEIINLIIPTDIYIRTELMCKCISSDIGVDWQVIHFIFYIYQSFIKDTIEKYEPKKIVKMITSHSKYFQKTTFSINGEEFSYSKYSKRVSKLVIELDKKEIEKGELILSEIRELYGCDVGFGELVSILWIDYIEEYKQGNNKKAYKALHKLVSESLYK
ncbi:MAG: hypothetical protein E7E64_04990 [Clostridium celatum]|uniref:hypothetical protein n=1 Tax=Clostridium tertium TaxID=1559 RepID=UPI002900660A|nr:hypothetical protein [Clostridium celatum]